MINQDDDADLKHNKITSFLIKEFGNSILFGDAEIKNQSFSFSSPTKVQNIINSLQNIDVVKTAAIDIRKSLLEVNFWLENSFYDAHQLKQSWKEITILDALLYFFTALFNVSSTKLMRSKTASGINDCIFEECLVEKENEEETQHSPLMTRTKSLFRMMYYNVTKGEATLSPPCYEYPCNISALQKLWIDSVIQQAIYLYQLQNNKKTEKRSRKIQSCKVPSIMYLYPVILAKVVSGLQQWITLQILIKIVYLEECMLMIQL